MFTALVSDAESLRVLITAEATGSDAPRASSESKLRKARKKSAKQKAARILEAVLRLLEAYDVGCRDCRPFTS